MKKYRETAFTVICIAFSLLMLLLSLVDFIRLAGLNDEAAGLEKEIICLRQENAVLKVELENSLSLAELEEYACGVLGMQRCSPGQIIYLEKPDTGVNG